MATTATEMETEGAVDEGRATERVLDDRTERAQMQWEREKAAAYADETRCVHCGAPIDDPRDAAYFPDVHRLAHRGECSVAVLQARWGHLFKGVIVTGAAA